MNWLRNKGDDDDIYDPNGEFQRLDGVLPKKHDQTVDDRARQIEACLDWIRSSENADGDEEMPSFENIESVFSAYSSPEQRSEDVEGVLNWLKRKGKKDRKYDPTGDFRKLDKLLPKKKFQQLKDRARAIEGALDYIRNSGVSLTDDGVIEKLSNLGSVPISKRTPEQRIKNQQDALNWLRNKGENDNLIDSTGEFEKLDSLLPKNGAQSLEDRAKEIEMSSDWIRNKCLGGADYLLGSESAPTFDAGKRSPEQRSKDLSDALNWLRNKGDDDGIYDPNGEFRRLDGMLPKKRGQSSEDRASEIEGALDWMRQKDVSSHGADAVPEFDKVPTMEIVNSSPEQNVIDLENALNWLRNKGKGKKYDANGEFRKLDAMLPIKQGQSPNDRAREIVGALDWCRMNNISIHDEDAIENFNKIGSVPVLGRSPEQRSKDLSDTSNWLRNKGKDDFAFDSSGEFRRLDDMLSVKQGQCIDDRAREIEASLDWIRQKDANATIDMHDIAFDTISSTIPVSSRSIEQRSKDASDILNWLRCKGQNDESTDPEGEFSKLDGMLPVKRGQSIDDRAREIESAMDWWRNTNHDVLSNDDVPDFKMVNSIPMSQRTPEERSKDLTNVLNWLRTNGVDDYNTNDPNGDFTRLNNLLPDKSGQTLEDRARDIEGVLDYTRNHNISTDDDILPALSKTGNLPISRRSPEERKKDVNDVLSWIRGDKVSALDPSGVFRKLDHLLPEKKKMSSKNRAREIERTLDWCRSLGVKPADIDSIPGSIEMNSVPFSVRSPEERKREQDNILDFLRNRSNNIGNPSNDFSRIDQMLPKKNKQTDEERASDIESTLDWLRMAGLTMDEEETPLPSLDKLASVPVHVRGAQERQRDLENVLNWIRQGRPVSEDPTGEFTKIEMMLPHVKGEKPRERAQKIEKAIDWVRNKGILPLHDANEIMSDFSTVDSIPIATRTPEERSKDLLNVITWLRDGKKHSEDPLGLFRKVDSLLPTKNGQDLRDRAISIENALDYCRNPVVKPSDDDSSVPTFSTLSSIPISHKSPEERKRDAANVLEWIRCGKPADVDSADEFKKIDDQLPVKKGQSPEDRARDIESVFDYCRNKGAKLSDDGSVPAFSTLSSIPVSHKSPEDRQKEAANVLEWIRCGKPADADSADEFKKIDDQLPVKKGQSHEDRARDIESVFDYCRNTGVKLLDDGSVPAFSTISSIPFSHKSPEERQNDIGNVLAWIRQGQPVSEDPTGEFAKIANRLPVKNGQSPEDRARDIESVFDFCRNKGVQISGDGSVPTFSTLSSIPVSHKSPKERKRDAENILGWIREGQPVSEDPTGEFAKIDNMLPVKKGQLPEDRARDIESVFDYCRNKGMNLIDDDGSLPAFSALSSIPITHQSPEDRQIDVENVLEWIRLGRPVSEDPTGEFTKIDNMLPSKKAESPEDRARDIESIFDYCRNTGVKLLDDDGSLPAFSTLSSIPVSHKSPEDRQKEAANVLEWIRQGQLLSEDPTGGFTKIDSMLPVKKGQAPEARARDIESSLNWCRVNDLNLDHVHDSIRFDNNPSIAVNPKTSEGDNIEVDDVLAWLRNGQKVALDPTGNFAKINQILPEKKGQTRQERAFDIEKALTWMRNPSSSLYDEDDRPSDFSKLPSIPVNRKSFGDQTEEMDNIMLWMRNSKDPIDDTTDGKFKIIDDILPMKNGETPLERAKTIDDALSWMRNISPTIGKIDIDTPALIKASQIGVSKRTPNDRKREADAVLSWIRQGKPDINDTEGNFNAIDKMLPPKKKQSPEDRAKDIESVIDWCRSMGVEPVTVQKPTKFDKLPSIPVNKRSPEDRQKDVDDITEWIREGRPSNPDTPTNEFAAIDQMLPPKIDQSPEDRASDVEGVLNWMRSNNVPPVSPDDEKPTKFDKLPSIPVNKRSPEDRQKDVDDITNWIREGRPSNPDTPTNEFAAIDQMLPPKTDQSPEDRASNVEGVLNWMRSNGVPVADNVTPLQFTLHPFVNMSKRSPEDRKNDIDNISTWIRNGKNDVDDTPDGDFRKCDQIFPLPKQESPEERARDIEGFLDWCRNSGMKPVDDASSPRFDKVSSIPVSRRSPEQRQDDLDDILTWLREGTPDSLDPTGEFKTTSQVRSI